MKKIAGITPQSRADFGKAHVIISEKRDKKAAKFLVKDLPYPYTSKAQFERSLENPLGKEWNTRIATQRATLPKVTKKVQYTSSASVQPKFTSVSLDGDNHQTPRESTLVPLCIIFNRFHAHYFIRETIERLAVRPLSVSRFARLRVALLIWRRLFRPTVMLWSASSQKVEPSHYQKLLCGAALISWRDR
jgi:hypothetical protein